MRIVIRTRQRPGRFHANSFQVLKEPFGVSNPTNNGDIRKALPWGRDVEFLSKPIHNF